MCLTASSDFFFPLHLALPLLSVALSFSPTKLGAYEERQYLAGTSAILISGLQIRTTGGNEMRSEPPDRNGQEEDVLN